MDQQLTPEQMQRLQQMTPEQRQQLAQMAQQGQGQAPQEMGPEQCVFCKIASKQMPAKIIEENDNFVAFLDIQPKAPGHTVIVPKDHKKTLIDTDIGSEKELMSFVRKVVVKLVNGLGASGYNIISSNGVSAGQNLPHMSVHVVPAYGQAPDLPVMNILQPAKIPDFVMEAVEKNIQKAGQQGDEFDAAFA